MQIEVQVAPGRVAVVCCHGLATVVKDGTGTNMVLTDTGRSKLGRLVTTMASKKLFAQRFAVVCSPRENVVASAKLVAAARGGEPLTWEGLEIAPEYGGLSFAEITQRLIGLTDEA